MVLRISQILSRTNNALAEPTYFNESCCVGQAARDKSDRADRPAEGPQALYAEAARRTKSAKEIGKAGKAKERKNWLENKEQ